MSETNISWQLTQAAARWPDTLAIAAPRRRRPRGQADYQQVTFAQLEEDTTRLAAGLQARGVRPGQRIVLLVRPGIDFIALTFALFKTGAVVVLIDPGMGGRHLLQCLEDVKPDGFITIPLAQAILWWHRRRFPAARLHVTHGRGWWGQRVEDLRRHDAREFRPVSVEPHDPAAIIFTTGSTGPPKGVLYQHGNFATQVRELQLQYGIEPGEIDLPGFPLFALFNSAMGVSTIIPAMDPRRPAQVDPRNIVHAVQDWQVTQAFGSPAIWNVVGRYCETHGTRLPSLRRVLSAGAPVPPHVLERMQRAIADEGAVHTPYGATESLPVATISSREVLSSTAALSRQGRGTCVGRRFPSIDWRIIEIDDGPLPQMANCRVLPRGQIGELIVRGPAITSAYVTRTEANALAKIQDEHGFWHRIGDVGYLDDEDRFWFCGRKAHRVITPSGTLFTIPCEAIFNQHPAVYRSALVGMGTPGSQIPAVVVEPWPERFPRSASDQTGLLDELYALAQNCELTRGIERQHLFLKASLPVDIRHNAKIFREKLGPWAAARQAKLAVNAR